MSLAGFKKQINKANQYVSEKIGGAKGTELDDEFVELEKKTESMMRLVDELMVKTHEMLQPNPASRARMLAVKSISKLRGQSNHSLYPQPEGLLGECMAKSGKELGEDSVFGQALVETGETYKQIAEMKYLMEDAVKQNFTEPLLHMQNKDLKEVNHHRKKMHGRRLDFDCKKRKQEKEASAQADEELRQAEEKFDESKQLAEVAMHNLFDNDVEQVLQLQAFIEAELTYHRQSADSLDAVLDSLKQKCSEASSRPKREFTPKKYVKTDYDHSDASISGPSCEALFDFEAENDGELGFKEGDIIKLTSRIDENWYEGELADGTAGYFPTNYVKVLVDLP